MSTEFKLIVGLGNPGSEHILTRHNAGFWFLDILVEKLSLNFISDKKFQSELCRYQNDNIDCWLCKPQTYMNDSGVAVKEYLDYFNIGIDQLLVIYDDADLMIGEFRFKSKGSSAGQKGLDSIIYHLQTDQFLRLKIGIRDADNSKPLKSYVLSPFQDDDFLLIEETIDLCCKAVNFLLTHNINETMNKYNKKNKGNK